MNQNRYARLSRNCSRAHRASSTSIKENTEVLRSRLNIPWIRTLGISVVAVAMAVMPAYGWGKVSQRIMSWTAIRALPPGQQQTLIPFEEKLIDGATSSDEVVARYFGKGSVSEMARAVAHEMSLLRMELRRGIDEYTAYRFGVLSQVIADLNQPFGGSRPPSEQQIEHISELRRQYELDVDRALQSVRYDYKRRKRIYDTEAYFISARRYVQQAEFFLSQDYLRGNGFGQYGQRSLNLYFDNAVNAIADIWFTILRPSQIAPLIRPEPSAIGLFRIEGIRYFLGIGQDRHAADAVVRLQTDGLMNAETDKQVSDVYYEANRHSRAIDGYLRVLEQQPNWPQVRARISNYYYALGSAYMKGGLLEEAQRAFERVLAHDPQYRPARLGLDTTIGLIAARSGRRNQLQVHMKMAEASEGRAMRSATDGDYAGAIRHLRNAAAIYSTVTTEFHREYRDAGQQLASINRQIANYSNTIIRDAIALDSVTEQMILSDSVQEAAKKHAAEFADNVTSSSHSERSSELQRQFAQQEREKI